MTTIDYTHTDETLDLAVTFRIEADVYDGDYHIGPVETTCDIGDITTLSLAIRWGNQPRNHPQAVIGLPEVPREALADNFYELLYEDATLLAKVKAALLKAHADREPSERELDRLNGND
jgi:hypothetical protein